MCNEEGVRPIIRRYLGSKITAFAALLSPCFSVLPLLLGISALKSERSMATFFIFFICVSCCLLWGFFLWKKKNQLYSWGVFSTNCVLVSVLFQKSFSLSYDICQGCGIGSYCHSFLNSGTIGSDINFIFLSIEPFDEKYRNQINRWQPSASRIKVVFDEELYRYLITTLPKKQALLLERDYYEMKNEHRQKK